MEVENPEGLATGVRISGEGLPSWLRVQRTSSSTARLEGIPTADDVGFHEIQLVGRNRNTGLLATQCFTITVLPTSVPPAVMIFTADPILVEAG